MPIQTKRGGMFWTDSKKKTESDNYKDYNARWRNVIDPETKKTYEYLSTTYWPGITNYGMSPKAMFWPERALKTTREVNPFKTDNTMNTFKTSFPNKGRAIYINTSRDVLAGIVLESSDQRKDILTLKNSYDYDTHNVQKKQTIEVKPTDKWEYIDEYYVEYFNAVAEFVKKQKAPVVKYFTDFPKQGVIHILSKDIAGDVVPQDRPGFIRLKNAYDFDDHDVKEQMYLQVSSLDTWIYLEEDTPEVSQEYYSEINKFIKAQEALVLQRSDAMIARPLTSGGKRILKKRYKTRKNSIRR